MDNERGYSISYDEVAAWVEAQPPGSIVGECDDYCGCLVARAIAAKYAGHYVEVDFTGGSGLSAYVADAGETGYIPGIHLACTERAAWLAARQPVEMGDDRAELTRLARAFDHLGPDLRAQSAAHGPYDGALVTREAALALF